MLLIKKGEQNKLVVSASQFKTADTPVYYLFSFQHLITKEKVRFYGILQNTNDRYDEFVIEEVSGTSTPEDLLNGNVEFNATGQYYYGIYQMGSQSLNPMMAIKKLEEGRAVILDDVTPTYFNPYVSSNEDNSNVVYYR